ncbi:MAG: class I SAM-dependent methyltransferase [Acidimicrobiaceae bacterium]|nr:class I SAM-dependent methyltransferase [Acidimicrobiaceae bacterium]
MSVPKTFGEVLGQIADVEGWLTEDQARRLYDRARELREDAQLVEIGSFRGRSLIVLASAAPAGVGIVSIDPYAGSDRGPQEIAPNQHLGDSDYCSCIDNLTRAGVADRVTHFRKMSGDALGDVNGGIDLLYIDGAHRFGPARRDIVAWGDRVADGGAMLIHDSFSSIGVTLALLTSTFAGSPWRYQGRSGSLAEYRREPMSGRESIVNALRQALQLVWFARNVVIKGALTLRLYPLTRLLGHRTRDWPY